MMNRSPLTVPFLTTLYLWLAAFAWPVNAKNSPHPKDLWVMTFNVENLFDTHDDPITQDETFLPLAKKQSRKVREICYKIKRKSWREKCLTLDWSEAALEKKLRALAHTIRSVNDGKGPDLLLLQEVENRAVLERLRNDHLADLNYDSSILIEGSDYRGIDVAILARLPLHPNRSPTLHPIKLKNMNSSSQVSTNKALIDARGFLEASFIWASQPVSVFVLHLPAPYHPTARRKEALTQLMSLVSQKSTSDLVIVGGDFNIPSTEERRHRLIELFSAGPWRIAHRENCKSCKGTMYYPPKKEWSFFDMLLLRPPKQKTLKILESRAVATPLSQTKEEIPLSWDPLTGLGVSDHFPLATKISLLD